MSAVASTDSVEPELDFGPGRISQISVVLNNYCKSLWGLRSAVFLWYFG